MSTTEQTVWNGAAALEPFLVPIGDLKESEGNPNTGDIPQIMLSLKRFGQVRPIATRIGGTIVAGHHVWKAAQRLGWTHLAAVVGDFVDESEAYAYLLADNRLAQLGTIDPGAFVQMAMPLADSGRLEGTGITMDYYEDNLSIIEKARLATEEFLEGANDRGETDEMAAERGAMIAAYQKRHEIVMLLDPAEYKRFGDHLQILRKEYGTDTVKGTVLKAMQTEAYQHNQGIAQDEAADNPDGQGDPGDEDDPNLTGA